MTCEDCGEREAKVKGVCMRCYQRRNAARKPWGVCKCGCGEATKATFVSGHNTRLLSPEEQGRRGRFCNGVERPNSGNWYRKVNYQHEHRTVAEKMLGRKLLKSEVVHHKNGKVRDNRPENLEVMSRSEHALLHFFGRRK
jgi:hypothetical protein